MQKNYGLPTDICIKLYHFIKSAKVTSRLFFRYNSYLTLGLKDNNEQLVAVMVLTVYPTVPAVLPGDWEKWAKNLYGLNRLNNCNSLWIRLLIWKPYYYPLFMKPIAQYFFNFMREISYLLMVIPPVDCSLNFLDNLGISIKPKGKVLNK